MAEDRSETIWTDPNSLAEQSMSTWQNFSKLRGKGFLFLKQ